MQMRTVKHSFLLKYVSPGRIKKRIIVKKKLMAIQEICGKHLVDPVYEEEIVEIEEIITDKTEVRNLKDIFITSVEKCILMKKVCNVFLEVLKDLETANFEKLCFQFLDDRESRLYR